MNLFVCLFVCLNIEARSGLGQVAAQVPTAFTGVGGDCVRKILPSVIVSIGVSYFEHCGRNKTVLREKKIIYSDLFIWK